MVIFSTASYEWPTHVLVSHHVPLIFSHLSLILTALLKIFNLNHSFITPMQNQTIPLITSLYCYFMGDIKGTTPSTNCIIQCCAVRIILTM